MTLDPRLWEQVRARANRVCEYCGVSEEDTGGMLTVDHHQPQSKEGTDEFENLVYCCFRCNTYKGNYWPSEPGDPNLWNPRRERFGEHLLLLPDGRLYPISPTGSRTLNHLHLNRPQLVAHRLRKLKALEKSKRVARLQESLASLDQLRGERLHLTEDQARLLADLRQLLELFLHKLD
jgi:hypothetical protein